MMSRFPLPSGTSSGRSTGPLRITRSASVYQQLTSASPSQRGSLVEGNTMAFRSVRLLPVKLEAR